MPNGDSVVSLNAWVAPEMNPPAAPAAIGSDDGLSSGAVELTPTPTSPRRYQPPNWLSAGDSGGRDGAGGKSAALANPHVTAATTTRVSGPSWAMTTVPSFGAGKPRLRGRKPGGTCHGRVKGVLTLTLGHNQGRPRANFGKKPKCAAHAAWRAGAPMVPRMASASALASSVGRPGA